MVINLYERCCAGEYVENKQLFGEEFESLIFGRASGVGLQICNSACSIEMYTP